ncbi:hypothetical protein TELCIR_06101 [Teladorsagia circumcincta]|uniref:Uncharacterized protein n=1 Tax=Teladorsagia circumcincta TaxID=45464 RepID=A0A2G9UR72_TELCI|nr:hypothetical protein TELCIR_06101 [Teladorsagia circumcincta]
MVISSFSGMAWPRQAASLRTCSYQQAFKTVLFTMKISLSDELLLTNFNRLTAGQGMKASTPREDVDCRLTAGTNVFGRYLNGVPQEKVCKTIAEEKREPLLTICSAMGMRYSPASQKVYIRNSHFS